MSFIKKIITAIPLQPNDLRKLLTIKPDHKKLMDAGLIILISFMIVVYKIYRANPHL